MSIAEKLVHHWLEEGLRLPSGVTEETLLQFERTSCTTLPQSFKDYLRLANGMNATGLHDQDGHGFSFWSIDRLRTVPEECHLRGIASPAIAEADAFLVFADYMQWSWAYALKMGANDNQVLQIGVREPRVVARSFEAFVDLYLQDSPLIYLPKA